MRLVELTLEIEAVYRELLDELGPDGQGSATSWMLEHSEEPFEVFVGRLQDWSRGKDLKDGWVAFSTFWLVDDDRIVGKSSLRHELNEHLCNIGGHIGYVICESFRRKGYGTEILRLTLEKAKELGLERVLVTCDEDNIASAKIIEKNGGIFENTYQDDELDVPKRRYWIAID